MKKKSLQLFILIFLSCCTKLQNFSNTKDLYSEMGRLSLDTALIVESQAIDGFPLWSPDSNFIAVNIEGKWYKFKLTNVELVQADWHQQKIGVVVSKNNSSVLTKEEQKEFYKEPKYDPREVRTNNGDKIKLELKGFSTSLILTKNNQDSKILWVSGVENCHSLSLSPDEKYIAYICELNGLFIMKIK